EGSCSEAARTSDDLADMPALELIHTQVNEVLPSSVQAFSKQIPEANDHVEGLSCKARFDLLQAPLSELINSFHSLANDDTNEPNEPTDPAELDVPTSIVHNVDLYATETEDVPETAYKFIEEDKLVSKFWADKVQEEDEIISE
ncbi:hypothetical protein V8G54_025268, partial [Vigna mungo]